MKELLKSVQTLTAEELARSYEKFPKFNSPHEGYAVIAEEIDELRDEFEGSDNIQRSAEWLWHCVKHNSKYSVNAVEQLKAAAIRSAAEAIQVAAMAQRYIDSLGGEQK